jgi:hypothetical protein
MRFHRAINVLILAAFLPLATGCTNRRTIEIDSDPSSPDHELPKYEPFEIEGYTLKSGQHFEWSGYVVLVDADSVLFTPKQAPSDVKPGILDSRQRAFDTTAESFTLDLQRLRSIDAVELDQTRSTLLVTGMVVAILALVGVAAVLWIEDSVW